MKIAFLLSDYGSGGAERTVAYLSEYFADNQHEIDIVILNGNVFYNNTSRINIIKGNISSKNDNIFLRIKAIFQRLAFVNKYLKNSKPDIVFCILSETVKYIIGHKKGFKLITSERNNPAKDVGRAGLFFRKLYFHYADGIVFQTERAKNFYSKKLQQKSIVIPNAIGNEYVYKVNPIIERKKKISAIGRLNVQKDYPTLIKAFKIVNDKYPDYVLEIYGKGELENELKELANSLKLSDKVIFAGICPDAIVKIADSTCYVLSSIYEGMPNALMEAMAVGLPCVSTDCPNGPAELIENKVNGLLVSMHDEKALSEAILKFIEDKEFADMCGNNAIKIKESHSIKSNAQKFLELIGEMHKA